MTNFLKEFLSCFLICMSGAIGYSLITWKLPPNPIFVIVFFLVLALSAATIKMMIDSLVLQESNGCTTKELRIFPRNEEDLRHHPRVKILGKDVQGFTIVEAKLKPEEGVCWRCGTIANDPDKNLQVCPVCKGDFND